LQKLSEVFQEFFRAGTMAWLLFFVLLVLMLMLLSMMASTMPVLAARSQC